MPSRILREGILTSEIVDSLSESAEILYRRLISVVDDYGRYFGHPGLIRAACYPLKLDKVPEKRVQTLLEELGKTTLIITYEVSGKKYIQINNFKQRQRTDSKFPAPCPSQCPSNDGQMTALFVVEDVCEGEGERGNPHPKKTNGRFIKPNLPEIREYCEQIDSKINPSTFFNHYETVGWKVGKNTMKDWKAAVRGWTSRENKS